jgi:3-hydroxyacyl-[acyl-carrier-protein] dehydratase
MRWFWVDRFTEFVAGSHAAGVKGVALSDEYLHDHWDCYPVMPNPLIAEGMAQTAGLLVSEMYQFKELVVLAKFTTLEFTGEVRPGDVIAYRAEIGRKMDVGAQCTVTGMVGERRQAYAEIFFGRLQPDPEKTHLPARLFDPDDLAHWLHTTGIFTVGVHPDGSRMKPTDYGLPVHSAS